jgi:2-(1,2-epoxy-1,2-dihydrophenyl)acetyl-CoA isomerase
MYNNIKITRDETCFILTFNRPEVLNSFNKEMALEVQSALKDARSDDTVRAVLLTGAGRAFCAGQDLAEAVPKEKPMADIASLVKESYNPIIRLIREIEKPVIAAVNGVAAGAGANIAIACDIVIASEKASFVQAFSKIGLVPDSGGTFFLPRIVGMSKASALMMLGEKISAVEALDTGMIYKVYREDMFWEETLKLTKKLSQMPTRGLGLTKIALNKTFDNALEDQLALEAELQAEAGNSEDYVEGVKAFIEKRAPNFKGK